MKYDSVNEKNKAFKNNVINTLELSKSGKKVNFVDNELTVYIYCAITCFHIVLSPKLRTSVNTYISITLSGLHILTWLVL